MKKIIFTFLTLCLIISFGFVKTVNAYDGYKLIEVNLDNEIKTDQSFQDLAEELDMEARTFIIKEDKNVYLIPTFRKTNEFMAKDNVVETTTYLIPKMYAQTYTGSKKGNIDIVASAAEINITIYYETYTDSGGFEYGKLTKAIGSVSGYNSGFKFASAEITLGSVGLNYPNQRKVYSTTSDKWTYSAPSSWQYNLMGNGFCVIGSRADVKITRDGVKMYTGSLNVNIG